MKKEKVILSVFFSKQVLLAFLLLAAAPLMAQRYKRHSSHSDTTHHRNHDELIIKLEEYSEQKGLIPRLLREIMVVDYGPATGNITNATQDFTEKGYEKYRGKIIANIHVTVLDPLGTSVEDTSKAPTKFIEKAGNAVHLKTRKNHIRNRLFFKEGDYVIPMALSESERLLRSSEYIFDAKILAIPAGKDSVNIQITVLDAWNITGDGSGDPGALSVQGSLRDVNFVGRGHSLGIRAEYYDIFKEGPYYDVNYSVPNILKSNIFGYAFHHNRRLYSEEAIGVNRGFFANTIKFAGGIDLRRRTENLPVIVNDTVNLADLPSTQSTDLWLGRAFAINSFSGNNWFVAGRTVFTRRGNRPAPDSVKERLSEDNLYLLSIGHSYRRFFKENYLFFLNRSEDLPAGRVFSLTGGYRQDEFYTAPYAGARAGVANFFQKFGYVSFNTRAGSFFRNTEFWQSGLSGDFLYFTPVLEPGVWKMRSLLWVRADQSLNPRNPGPFNINNREGIRGFSNPGAGAAKRLSISHEYVFFSPLVYNGFRFAYVFFADWAWLAPLDRSLGESGFFHGYGVGLRFKNNNFIFRTFQLSFTWYPPGKGLTSNQFAFLFDDNQYYRYNVLEFGKPATVTF